MDDLEKINKFEKYAKRVFFVIAVLAVLKMTYEIYAIPDYRGHKANFVYSKDKQYKGILVSPHINEWWPVAILVRTSDNEVLAYEHLSRDSSVINGWFSDYCSDNNDRTFYTCFEPADFMDPISVPPSLWHRVHAWLTVRIRGFQNPNLQEYEVDK